MTPSDTRPDRRRGAVVLAGGRSTRMGTDKASLELGGTSLLSRVVLALSEVVDEIAIVSRRGQSLPEVDLAARTARSAPPASGGPTRGEILRTPILVHVHDEREDRGPLGGMAPGLEALGAPVAFVSSCDVPFLSPGFVRAMFDALGDADVAIPEAGGRLHPLGAVYRRTVAPVVRELLAADRLRPVFLLERVPHVRVPEARLREVDPGLDSLANLNTQEDLEAARARLLRDAPPR